MSKADLQILVALVHAAQSNLYMMRNARSAAVRKCCMKRVRKLESRLGTEVVQAVSIAVARSRNLEFEMFEGRCTKKQICVPTCWVQQMILGNGIGVCPVCGAIVLRDDMDRGRPNVAAATAT